MAVLTVVGITKAFAGFQALSDIHLGIAEGQVVGLIGPNGSGKTTLFNVISGIYKPTEGNVLFGGAGVDIAGKPPHWIAKLGIGRTFQNPRLFWHLSVLENVMIGMDPHLKASTVASCLSLPAARHEERTAQEHALHLLSFFGKRLTSMAEEPALALSYANRRRLEIVRALALEPVVVLLDEPSAGMNPVETQDLIRDIIRINERGIAILLIEHKMEMVAGLADWVVALNHGTKIAEGNFEEVRQDEKVLKAYMGSRKEHVAS